MSEDPAILVVDDDPDIRDTLQEYFETNGFAVSTFCDGTELRAAENLSDFSLAILDLKLPGEDGLSLCRFLRDTTAMGIVMLTGSADAVDRVVGLEVGADDYVAKPFEARELLARIRAILRRLEAGEKSVGNDAAGSGSAPESFMFGPFKVNPHARVLTRPDGAQLPLTGMEFDLLKAFAERPNRVLTRDTLLEIAHGRDWEPYDRSIDIRVTRLRKKIEPVPERPAYIKTVRGVGYLYDPQGK